MFRDKTERKDAERQLRDTEEFIKSVVESSPDCLKVLDLDGRLMFMNRNGCRQMEIDDFSTCHFRFWPEFWNGEEREKAIGAIEAARCGEIVTFEGYSPTAKGKPRWWEVIVSPIRDASGKPVRLLSVSRDITERKRIQSAMQIAHEQLAASALQLQRSNEDLSQFAHVASHDLRSPLNSILQFAALLERRHGEQLGSEGKECVAFLSSAAKRMAKLIEDLLQYAKSASNSNPGEPVNSNSVVNTALENLRREILESDATITHDDLPAVLVAETSLLQIFQNLIGNAIRYRGDDAPQIHIAAAGRDHQWLFSCTDNGIGIPPQFQEQIFEPFKRLHGAELPGSGIGLAVCKKIIERHQGRIWAESNPQRGSTFFFTLPKAAVVKLAVTT